MDHSSGVHTAVGTESEHRKASPGASAARLAAVNGLRGWAILSVIYCHFLDFYLTPFFFLDRTHVGKFLFTKYTLASNGWLGVNLFFVLSGFVLTLPYAQKLRSMQSFADAGAFWLRRARRLLPLYYFVMLVTMFAGMSANLWSMDFLKEFFAMTTVTFVFGEKTFMPRYNIVLWSLGVEFWFSVFFPLLLILWRRVGIGMLTIFSLIVAASVRYHAAHTWPGSHLAEIIAVKDGLFGRFDDFVIGMLVCHWYARGRLPRGALAVGALVTGILCVALGASGWDNIRLNLLPFEASAFINVIVGAGFALILLALLGGVPAAIRVLFTNAPLQLCGMMSYSLYIWHMAGPIQRLAPWWDLQDVPVYIALLLPLAMLTYRFIEFPRESVQKLFFTFPDADLSLARISRIPHSLRMRRFLPSTQK